MNRRRFLCGLAAAATAAATPALAKDYVGTIIRQLRDQGFRDIVEARTLLGRVRIAAVRPDGLREIIVNPLTGEILRDLWLPVAGGSGERSIIGADHDDDDDDKDDDEDDDRRGSGKDDADDNDAK